MYRLCPRWLDIIAVNGKRRPVEAPNPPAPTDGLPGIGPQQPGASPRYSDGESQQEPRYGGGADEGATTTTPVPGWTVV
ncbi:hypothetical protein MCOR25_003933 [Pyricularia grisea]|nr:hypothetical protein MCOR25_003933 [Pyricularia grisea]